jgi:hypothetical protein
MQPRLVDTALLELMAYVVEIPCPSFRLGTEALDRVTDVDSDLRCALRGYVARFKGEWNVSAKIVESQLHLTCPVPRPIPRPPSLPFLGLYQFLLHGVP